MWPRNSRVIDIIRELEDYGMTVDVHDPWANPEEALGEYGVTLVDEPAPGVYGGIVLAVAHHQFRDRGAGWVHARGTQLVADNLTVVQEASTQLAESTEVTVADVESLHCALLPDQTELHGIRNIQNWIGGSDFNPLQADSVPSPPGDGPH